MDNLEKLNDYIIEELEMELMDDRIVSVKDEIEYWEKHKDEWNTDYTYVTEELKKYKDYNSLYSINHKYGGCWGQGYIIVDKELEYVGFVRTI
ncbi:hypothetical protein [Clostridium brassicae]|uniref:Uncharacterized protein n=1 Tax=Clostridium brassicae TaxID=2999072 RepID=A0ABT4D9H6_9CLOT|nr:hypothetical protein [Clostridium brassicae]MCY6958293.1 hypothetical protein [Clostridium brassicae]